MWKPDIKDSGIVTPEAYKIIYDEGNIRFEECASESESITNKSIKILVSMLAFGGFFTGFYLKDPSKYSHLFLIIVTIIYVLDLYILYKLISPRKIYHRGLMPNKLFPIELDTEKKEEQESIVYYTAIIMLQNKIEEFYSFLNKRGRSYKAAIILSFLLLFTFISSIGILIFHF